MNSADSGERYPGMSTRSVARVVLTLYGISLAVIALWPVPVDRGAAGFLQRVGRVLPALTYPRIEFTANILLFVPLGVLLMLILRRRYLILPIAIVVTVAIECSQALLLDKRTPSVLDIIANTAGACVGMMIVAAVESWRARASREGMRAAVRGDADPWAALGIVPPDAAPRPAPPLPPASASPAATASASAPLPSWIPPMPPPPAPLDSAGEPLRL
ncbi:MAG: VanZ family protein [Microbacterium sp.]